MNQYNDNQEPFSEQKKYYIDALQYANRRAIVKKPSDFQDVFHVYILTFSPELRNHILRADEDALNEVINEAVKRIIKARKPDVYYDYLQFEPLRWDLINGDGNGNGDGSLICEHVTTADTESEEALTILQRLAKRLMNDNYFKTMRDNKELYWYDGSKYISGQEWRIEEFCQINVPKIKTYEVQEIINHIKRLTFVDRSEFDKDPYIRNTTNGLLNLKTSEIKPHTNEYLSLTQLPEEYNPEARCPNIDKFLSDVLRPKDIQYILQLIGYCLLNDCRYQVSVMLYGHDGANGKGTLLDLVTTFLGVDNCSHRSLQSIDNNRFAVADLFGKMANTYADLKSTKLSETGNYKMLVTGDWITGEFKNKNAFKFRNKAKLWFSANEIPESDDKTDAFCRRW
jgi:phage/plasmid-associated DNA primase